MGVPERRDQEDIRGEDDEVADDEKEEEVDCTGKVRQADVVEGWWTPLRLIFKLV